jgi:integrase
MPRPRTALGTTGKINVTPQTQDDTGRWVTALEDSKPQRWRARARHRDSDGRLREVERFAPTKAKAVTELKRALAERTTPGVTTNGMRPDSSVTDAGALWIAQVERHDSALAERTKHHYRYCLDNYVTPAVGSLTLREVNAVPALRNFLQSIADSNGAGAAKSARSVLSNVLRMAVLDGALERNAMRDVPVPKAGRTAKATPDSDSESAKGKRVRDTRRGFTREERDLLLVVADSRESTQALDVADIVAFMAGTGVRISEALGQRWEDIDLAGELPTVHVQGSKSASANRVLVLAPWLADRLRRRAAERGSAGMLFPSPYTGDKNKPRDARNVSREFRAVLDEAGFPWATPHTCRRTVASLIDGSGFSIAEAANYLGHADPSVTARVYLGRKGTTARAATAL